MRSLLVFFAITISANAIADSSQKPTDVTIPDAVLALEASEEFPVALAAAKDALQKAEFAGLDSAKIMIFGYTIEKGVVTISVGTITRRWPTGIYKTGEIRAKYNPFPDGVNGVEINEVSFVAGDSAKEIPLR